MCMLKWNWHFFIHLIRRMYLCFLWKQAPVVMIGEPRVKQVIGELRSQQDDCGVPRCSRSCECHARLNNRPDTLVTD